jgi:hypothetical protein
MNKLLEFAGSMFLTFWFTGLFIVGAIDSTYGLGRDMQGLAFGIEYLLFGAGLTCLCCAVPEKHRRK